MWKTIIMFNMENYLDNYLETGSSEKFEDRQTRCRSFRRFLPFLFSLVIPDPVFLHVLKLRLKQTKSDFWFDPTIWLVRLNLSALRKKKKHSLIYCRVA